MHVALVGERRNIYRVLVGKPEGKRPLEDPGVDERIILRCIFRSGMWGHVLDQSGLEQGQVAGTCECGNEPSGSTKCVGFLD